MNNGPIASIIGSVSLALAGMIIGWLSAHNIIPAADVTQDTALVTTALVGAIGAGVVWFKAHSSTVSAHIAAVNATDGVKVVNQATQAPAVSEPPKV